VKSLRGKAGVVILLGCIFISGIVLPDLALASDRDVDPYLIYVDPITGKYTTQKPGHETTTSTQDADTKASINLNPVQAKTRFTPVLIMTGGILLFSHLLALGLVKRRTG
jgi:hypothetical protein